MALHQKTSSYYTKNSKSLAKKFAEFGDNYNIEDIIRSMDKPNPSVLEIGCGDGRDAKRILKCSKNYLGFDISSGMIKLARKKVPKGKFLVKNFEEYKFPSNIDIIFALTSLLHSNKTQLKKIFRKAYNSLNPGGIFYISLKYDKYHRQIKNDDLGVRAFYFYTPKDIREIATKKFEVLDTKIHVQKAKKFFIIILRKI